jgi:hypothetical protein
MFAVVDVLPAPVTPSTNNKPFAFCTSKESTPVYNQSTA